jgi:lytic murein transglycosylase
MPIADAAKGARAGTQDGDCHVKDDGTTISIASAICEGWSMKKWILAALLGAFSFAGSQLMAQDGAFTAASAVSPQEAGFQAYLLQVAARARAQGISERAIQTVMAGLTYNPRVIALDRSQPGGTPQSAAAPPDFTPYRLSHVDPARITRGRAMYRAVSGDAARIEARYGVPAPIVLAIWGAETDYGGNLGNFDLPRSLATLAYDGRRRDLFENEFIALLKMVDNGVPRSRLNGSWAGAFGNPQFLPSAYLRVARDGDGDGYADIWTNRADTMASIANYFRDAGWRPGQPWGVRASVPDGFDRAGNMGLLQSPNCPRVHARHSRWRTVGEWRQMGVIAQGPIRDDVLTTLIEPDGPGKPAFLLTGNYRVILDYNCSNYYALSVGWLADEIARNP